MTTGTGPDLLFQDEIRAAVREAYGGIPRGAGRAVTDRFYPPAVAEEVPAEALEWALGVGDPITPAALQPGEVVLDVGCGAGIDTVLAARRVGPDGRVIALDLLGEMAARCRASVRAAGVEGWCDVRTGEMEAIPLADGTVDVVVSNGVLNLSPRKSRAIAEMARVLGPGGRLSIADLVVDRELPPEILASGPVWAGCIGGAVSAQLLERKLERAGFADVRIDTRGELSLDDLTDYPLFPPDIVDLMRHALPEEAQASIATSVVVRAVRSTEPPSTPTPPVRLGPTRVTPLEEIEPETEEAAGVVVRALKDVDDVHLKVLDVAPGQSTPFHTHLHAHEGVVVAGRGELQLSGGSRPLAPGDVFTVNPNDPHAIRCDEGAEPLRFVCMDCFVE